jgi:hypothetical protein
MKLMMAGPMRSMAGRKKRPARTHDVGVINVSNHNFGDTIFCGFWICAESKFHIRPSRRRLYLLRAQDLSHHVNLDFIRS